MRQRTFSLILVILSGSLKLSVENGSFVPRAVVVGGFGALTSQSPFSRSINLNDSLILTGIAMVDQDQVATLLSKEAKETFVVSSQLNLQGWKMVELKKDERSRESFGQGLGRWGRSRDGSLCRMAAQVRRSEARWRCDG